MGIRNIYSFLSSYEGVMQKMDSYKDISANRCRKPIVVAIDMNLYYYKFIKSKMKNPFQGFLSQIIRMKEYSIKPLYVMDGKGPPQKRTLINKRKNTKNFEFIDYSIIKKYFDILNVDYVHSPVESDVFIGFLYKKKIIDYCLTEDFDIMLYGCDRIFSIEKGLIKMYSMKSILDILQISFENFLLFCVFLGCDYNNKIFRIGSNELFDILYQNNFDIKIVIDKLNSMGCFSFYQENVQNVIQNSLNIYSKSSENLYKEFRGITFTSPRSLVEKDIWGKFNSLHFVLIKDISYFLIKKYISINNRFLK